MYLPVFYVFAQRTETYSCVLVAVVDVAMGVPIDLG